VISDNFCYEDNLGSFAERIHTMPSALVLYNDYTREEIHDVFDPDSPFTPQRGTWGILGLIPLPDRSGDYVFLVTYGQSQGDHIFDEGISPEGFLRWQSQPRQTLTDSIIQQLIHHDEDRHSIYLFLRTTERQGGAPRPYTYLGRLKYIMIINASGQFTFFGSSWIGRSHLRSLGVSGCGPMNPI
jgi:hypothetical protein